MSARPTPQAGRLLQQRWVAAGASRLTMVVLATLLSAGCWNPFRPSEPAPPASGVTVTEVAVDYSTPDATLATLAAAIQAKDQANGLTAYVGALATTADGGEAFTCVLDPDVVSDRKLHGHQVPDTWTADLEANPFYHYLAQQNGGDYVLTWGTYSNAPLPNDDDVAGLATRYLQYQLSSQSADGVAESVSLGRADLIFRRNPSKQWLLATWVDHIDPTAGVDPSFVGYRSFSRLRIDSTGK